MVRKHPFFSIITCTYNSEKFIRDNLYSVFTQNYQNIEHIFIDGFSKDNTIRIIKKYKQEASFRVKILRCPPKGISNAMNKGIKHAEGDVLMHLNSDDYLFDKAVLADVRNFFLLRKQLDWLYGKINNVNEANQSLGTFPEDKLWQQSFSYLLKYFNFIPHQAVFIKKNVFTKNGMFDETNPSTMDYDLWLRIRNTTKWNFFNRIISSYRIHKGSNSSNIANKEKNIQLRKYVQRKYANSFEYFFINLYDNWIDSRNNSYA